MCTREDAADFLVTWTMTELGDSEVSKHRDGFLLVTKGAGHSLHGEWEQRGWKGQSGGT